MQLGLMKQMVDDLISHHGELASLHMSTNVIGKDTILRIYDEDSEAIGIVYGFNRDTNVLMQCEIPSTGPDIERFTKEYK